MADLLMQMEYFALLPSESLTDIETEQTDLAPFPCEIHPHILMGVFMWLPPLDRLRVEFVSKKWRTLAKKYSWISYHVLDCKHFPKSICSTPDKLFRALSDRCGKRIDEINMRKCLTGSHFFKELKRLPNVKHLYIDNQCALPRDCREAATSWPVQWFSTIKSVAFYHPMAGSIEFLQACRNVQYLRLEYDRVMSDRFFRQFPASIRCLALKYPANSDDFNPMLLRQMMEERLQIESLEISNFVVGRHLAYLEEVVPLTLKYLDIAVGSDTERKLVPLIRKLINLKGFKLFLDFSCEIPIANEALREISTSLVNLEHFDFTSVHTAALDPDKIVALGNLPHLCSIALYFNHKSNYNVVARLFEALSSKGQLKYFAARGPIPIPIVCHAIQQCPDLTTVFFWNRRAANHLFFRAVDQRYGKSKPTIIDEEKIVHVCFGGRDREPRLRHSTWVRVYADFEQLPVSRVVQQIRRDIFDDLPCSFSALPPATR